MIVKALSLIVLHSPVNLQHKDPDPPGPWFERITASKDIEAFESRVKELPETMNLERFGEPYVAYLKRQRPNNAQNVRCYIDIGSYGLSSMGNIILAPLTPLKDGYIMKVTYHLRNDPDEIQYLKFLPKHLLETKSISTPFYAGPRIDRFYQADIVILLDSPNFKFKIVDSTKHEKAKSGISK
jgi:hypothetical protein